MEPMVFNLCTQVMGKLTEAVGGASFDGVSSSKLHLQTTALFASLKIYPYLPHLLKHMNSKANPLGLQLCKDRDKDLGIQQHHECCHTVSLYWQVRDKSANVTIFIFISLTQHHHKQICVT